MAVTADQVYGDPEWARAQPGLALKFSAILKQYGIVPDQATLAKYGLGDYFSADDATAAQNNPYSIAAQLKDTLSGNLTNNATNANSHGALFSGAFKNMQDASGRDYTKNYALAGDSELGGLLGIQSDREGLYNSIYGRLLAQPPAPSADTSGLSITGSGTAADPTIVSNPYVPNPTTPSNTNTGGFHVPGTNGKALTTKPKVNPIMAFK